MSFLNIKMREKWTPSLCVLGGTGLMHLGLKSRFLSAGTEEF
jgi:hypothetical protein